MTNRTRNGHLPRISKTVEPLGDRVHSTFSTVKLFIPKAQLIHSICGFIVNSLKEKSVTGWRRTGSHLQVPLTPCNGVKVCPVEGRNYTVPGKDH